MNLWKRVYDPQCRRRVDRHKLMKKQLLTLAALGWLLGGLSAPVSAQDGFYGGVSLREAGSVANGLVVGSAPLSWTRFSTSIITDDFGPRSLVYGGYRWSSNIAIEAAFNSVDNSGTRLGLGLPAGGVGLVDTSVRHWNADVYTSWEFVRNVSLYGRLGYAQTDNPPLFSGASLVPTDPRRQRDGVNYGVGLRYDLSQSLGLRVEYARYSHFAGDAVSVGPLPESDQLTFGFQFRF